MGDWQPGKLVAFTATRRGGTLLVLHDGQRIAVEASEARLSTLLGRSLAECAAAREIDVYPDMMVMTEGEWEQIRALLRTTSFGGSQRVAALLALPFGELAAQPQRVYGGTCQGTTLYLSLPMTFRRRGDLHHALFDDEDHLWRMAVDLTARTVRVESGSVPGHFVR